jgi:hypothetical protein
VPPSHEALLQAAGLKVSLRQGMASDSGLDVFPNAAPSLTGPCSTCASAWMMKLLHPPASTHPAVVVAAAAAAALLVQEQHPATAGTAQHQGRLREALFTQPPQPAATAVVVLQASTACACCHTYQRCYLSLLPCSRGQMCCTWR